MRRAFSLVVAAVAVSIAGLSTPAQAAPPPPDTGDSRQLSEKGTTSVDPDRQQANVDSAYAESMKASDFHDDYLAAAGPAARRVQAEYNIPASVAAGQSVLESDWGRSTLSANDRNYFGFKCVSPSDPGPIATGCHQYNTTECTPLCHPEVAYFRVYRSMEDSFRDYGRLITTSSYYANALPYRTDPDRFIREVAKSYATDPDYATKVIDLMRNYDLYSLNSGSGMSSPIAVGSDGLQMVLMADGTVLAKHGIGLYGWTRETDARVAKIATNGGVQMILDKDGTVWAKNTVGLYDWVYEADPGVTDIAVGNDGTQMILKNDGTVWAKNTIGLYGWTQETDGIASAIAAGANGLQMILTTDGTVHAKTGIGLYGWTRESDATVTKIATNGGVQMILDKDGAVSAKTGIGLYGWTFEADRVTLDIAVGSDGTQMIRKNDGTVYAKNTIGTYGWTFEADAGTHHIATNAGIQLIVHPQGTVYARQGIDTYGWTLETDNIK
jgi:flagellum-specific peptidoglycan hydrolase FlgJ